MSPSLFPIRCPWCNRLAARVSEQATVEVRCARCHEVFTQVASASRSAVDGNADRASQPFVADDASALPTRGAKPSA